MAGNAIITNWSDYGYYKCRPMQAIITVWVQGFAELLLQSAGLCVLARLSTSSCLVACAGRCYYLLLLWMRRWKWARFQAIWDGEEQMMWKETFRILQHFASTRMRWFHWRRLPTRSSNWWCSLTGMGWYWLACHVFLAPLLKLINTSSLIATAGCGMRSWAPNCLLNQLNPFYRCLPLKWNLSFKRETAFMWVILGATSQESWRNYCFYLHSHLLSFISSFSLSHYHSFSLSSITGIFSSSPGNIGALSLIPTVVVVHAFTESHLNAAKRRISEYLLPFFFSVVYTSWTWDAVGEAAPIRAPLWVRMCADACKLTGSESPDIC